ASVDVPAMVVTGGPMLSGRFRKEHVGACTDCWRLHDDLRAERISDADWNEFELGMCRSYGHCSPMGTASTMACMAEALGLPSGGYLMEDFFYAGGLPAVLAQIPDLLHLDARTVTGRALGEELTAARIVNDDVIRTRDRALLAGGSLAVLRGSLCPDGAVLKV